MWEIETSVTLVIYIILRLLIAIETLAVEVARHHGLAVTTYM